MNISLTLPAVFFSLSERAADVLHDPGGATPAIDAATAAFEKSAGTPAQLVAAPTSGWIGPTHKKADMRKH